MDRTPTSMVQSESTSYGHFSIFAHIITSSRVYLAVAATRIRGEFVEISYYE